MADIGNIHIPEKHEVALTARYILGTFILLQAFKTLTKEKDSGFEFFIGIGELAVAVLAYAY